MSMDDDQMTESMIEADDNNVRFRGNNVFFYAPVSNTSVVKLISILHRVAGTLSQQRDAVIYLFINSEGGDLYAGMAAMDHIMTFHIPIYTVIEGFAASAATLISIAGKKRFIMPHAHLLIHQLSTGFWGKYHEMVEEYKTNKRLMSVMTRVYSERTKLERDDVKNLLKSETHIGAKKAIRWGLVDELYGHKAESTRPS